MNVDFFESKIDACTRLVQVVQEHVQREYLIKRDIMYSGKYSGKRLKVLMSRLMSRLMGHITHKNT